MLSAKRLQILNTSFGSLPLMTVLALLAVYIIWGSTYLALAIVVKEIPPYYMTTIRFTTAGGLLFLVLWLRGEITPTRRQWRNTCLVGMLMVGGGQGGVAFAEQWVASGLAALAVATMPLWAVLINSYWERLPGRMEFVGLAFGTLGVIILNLGADLWVNSAGGFVLFLAPVCWALGSIWSRQLDVPSSGLMSTAAMMLGGAATTLILGLVTGERITHVPSGEAIAALVYLIVLGSWMAFTAYMYLLRAAPPAMATSYAYVNPVIAVCLGWLLVGEALSWKTFVAALFILTAVVIITGNKSRKA